MAPGAETLRALFGDAPTLILLDELSVYLRKVGRLDDARGQLTAFLTSLFKAVESTPNAAPVYTLAIGKDGRATDAYSSENQFVADRMAEIESVSARKATLLDPTEDDETVQVLRRRLFEHIDDAGAAKVVDAYRGLWAGHQDALADDAARPETAERFRASYPLHPHVLDTLTGKTATLDNFQRVRGMLRLLARTVAHLWRQRPADATAVHLHHIDPGHEPIRQEIVTRLGQTAFVPAITNDIAAGRAGQRALAEDIDAHHHQGLPPYAAYVARTIFMHTLAFNEPLKGLTADELRYRRGGAGRRPELHRRGAQAVHHRVGLPRRPARGAHAVPGRGQPERGDPARGAGRRPGRGPCAAQRPHSGHLQGQDVRGRSVPRRPVRRPGRGGRRPPEARRVRLRRPGRRRDRRRGARARPAGCTRTRAPTARRYGPCATIWSSWRPTSTPPTACAAA